MCIGVLHCLLLAAALESAEPASSIPVRFPEGELHGFLVLKTLAGETIADGDNSQSVRADRVETRTVFRFRDGSVHDETTVYSQGGGLKLVSDRLVQRGPS